MSSQGINTTLQTNFVRTEVQIARRMLRSAAKCLSDRQHDGARESLGMAQVALSGAEKHMAVVKLPAGKTKTIKREVRELWRRIRGIEIPAA